MRSRFVFVLGCLALACASAGIAHGGDAAFDWSLAHNPSNGWGYGWAAAPGAAFQPFAFDTSYASGLGLWRAPNGASIGLTCTDLQTLGVTYPGGHVALRTGSDSTATVLRWTATSAGSYHVSATCLSADGYPSPSGAVIEGSQTDAALGYALAIGDVNGDGYADVVVGQPGWSNGQGSEGRLLLYLGNAYGLDTTPAWTYESNVALATLGKTVAVGDFNRDGYADIVAGAPGLSSNAGGAYVFRGSASTPTLVTTLAGTAGSNEGKGCTMGDFDGDGYSDIVVSDGGGVPIRALLYRGNPAFTFGTPVAVSPGGAIVDGAFGSVMAAAGDVDGDGRADLLIGDPTTSTTDVGGGSFGGRVFLYFGSAITASSWGTTWVLAGAAGTEIGTAVSAAGDVNRDGHDDFLVSTPVAGQGRVYLFLGAAGTPTTAPVWALDGPSGSFFGSAMGALGDANGDGYGDFMVGSSQYTNGQSKEGRVQLFLGGPTATPVAGDSIESNNANALLGSALATGDVDGDGIKDFVAGAPSYTGGVLRGGRVYLVAGAGQPPRRAAHVDARLVVGGVTIARDTIDTAAHRDTVTLAADVALGAGASVDLEIADLDPSTPGDLIRVDEVTEPSIAATGPKGPVYALGGQRFVPIQGVKSFEALAYDPLARKFASNGSLYDACGNRLSNGPDGPGIAWDPVTRTFWNIKFDAGTQSWVVSSFDTTSLTLTTQATIPRVLTVPGTGPDTLEDARGLAVDSSSVYVVDAGAVNLQPPANAWFRFARDGTPLASLKGASFGVNALSDVVDDIVWSPHASPTEPGRLLVAVEHTGIVALDLSGAVVDTFTWSAQGVKTSDRPSGFAGLALDPGSGDLFLADNDRSLAAHWVRLANAGLTSYLVGDGNPLVFHEVGPACANPVLWNPTPPKAACPTTPAIFGLAYRSVDQRVYGVDYGDGTLWKFDPRSGAGVRVGPTFVISLWGLAYDTQRDVLYGLEQGPGYGRIWRIDPRTARATPLPNVVGFTPDDIAFEPNGGVIYGHGTSGPDVVLVRIDRDTGIGTVVGPTVPTRGLDYDAVRGALIGINSTDSLYSINPATGAGSPIGLSASPGGWEGLAVVPVAPFALASVPREPATPGLFLALSAWPRPAHGRASLTFALPWAADVRLDLYDVGGRLVRRVGAGRFAAGPHTLEWDGRLASGEPAAAGVYFARLRVGGGPSVVSRVVLTR